jgi:CHAT domain-containing protein
MARGFLTALAIGGIALLCTARSFASPVDDAYSRGVADCWIGNFRGGIVELQSAWTQYSSSQNLAGESSTAIQLARAYEGTGDYFAALAAVRRAQSQSGLESDFGVRLALAQAIVLARNDSMGDSMLGDAQSLLTDLQNEADENHDTHLQAQVADEMGELFLAAHQNDQAAASFEQSVELAQSDDDKALIANASSNAAVAWLAVATDLSSTTEQAILRPRDRDAFQKRIADAIPRSIKMNDLAAQSLQYVAVAHDRLYLTLTVGQTYESLAKFSGEPADVLHLKAFELYRQTIDQASAPGDLLAQAYAYGLIGHLYEDEGSVGRDDAMRATRRAIFYAEECQDFGSLYRWQWQIARLLDSQGPLRLNDAINAMGRSLQALRAVRTEISAGGGNAQLLGFRDAAEGPFYELADLLLRRAENEDYRSSQADLQAAQNVVEELKTTQLQSYLGERCDALFESRQQDIKQIDAQTVLVYFVPLHDRTVILVGETDGDESTYRLHQIPVPVSQQQLYETAREFYAVVTDPGSGGPALAVPSERLYDWLITPIKPILAAKKQPITLVFIPDGVLRTIPMAALYDSARKQFLVQEYAVAISPGLKLNPLGTSSGKSIHLLANGVSEGVQGFSPLVSVTDELDKLHTIFGNHDVTLLNKDFVLHNFDDQLGAQDYSIVHISSHGTFGQDAQHSFILAYDQPVDLNHLQMDIEPNRFKGRPVELLTLSCCETAAGNDRAALGLAGVAVKAGARSALASLWSISDEAAASLMPKFYTELKSGDVSKAQALAAAQRALIADPNHRLNHPAYWAPFIIVGDWR